MELEDKAILRQMNQKYPRISELPAYDKKKLTTERARKIDQILEIIIKNRQGKIDWLQMELMNRAKKIFSEIRKDTEKLNRYKIKVDTKIIDKQRQILQKNNVLYGLIRKRYRTDDADCLEILKLPGSIPETASEKSYKKSYQSAYEDYEEEYAEYQRYWNRRSWDARDSYESYEEAYESYQEAVAERKRQESQTKKKKQQKFRKFEYTVLLEGVDVYYKQVFNACNMIFAFIENAITQQNHAKIAKKQKYTAEIERLSQKSNKIKKQQKSIKANLRELQKNGNFIPEFCSGRQKQVK